MVDVYDFFLRNPQAGFHTPVFLTAPTQGPQSLLVWGSQKAHLCVGAQYEDQRGVDPAISKDVALSSGNQGSGKPGTGGGDRAETSTDC